MPVHTKLLDTVPGRKSKWVDIIKKDFKKRWLLYLMALPIVMYYLIFCYWPMYGAVIAFKDFSPSKGIFASSWAGLKHFENFFGSYYIWRLIRNTFLISFYDIIFGFPAPIILALMLNEVRKKAFKSIVQTITYLPHFISVIVLCGIIVDFTSKNGVINDLVEFAGGGRISYLLQAEWFRPIFVGSGIWQHVGWGSIIYLAALTAIDQNMYEAAKIDGAGRFKQLLHVTIPGILPTIIILFILRAGQMMNVGFEKIILLYNPNIYETADVISSFVYRKGLLEMNYSYSSAVGLFNSVINFSLLILTNKLSKMTQETSLW